MTEGAGAYRKIAITVPAATFAALESARAKLGRSRSEVIAAAVDDWLRALAGQAARRRYVDGYLRVPEIAADADVATVVAATGGWSRWTGWGDEHGQPVARAAEPRPTWRTRATPGPKRPRKRR